MAELKRKKFCEISQLHLSEERLLLEVKKLKKQLEDKNQQGKRWEDITKTIKIVLKKDSERFNNKETEKDVLSDDEVAELANYILLEFNHCKEQLALDFENFYSELKSTTKKKDGYKRTAAKLSKKLEECENSWKTTESEKNDEIRSLKEKLKVSAL